MMAPGEADLDTTYERLLTLWTSGARGLSHHALEDRRNEPPVFEPNWAFRRHRQWWAHRAISFPWFFGSVYTVLLLWSVTHLLNA